MLRNKYDEAKLHSEPSSCYAIAIENLNNKAITTSVTEQQNKVEHTKLLRTAISVSKGLFLFFNAYVPIFQAFLYFGLRRKKLGINLETKPHIARRLRLINLKNAFINRFIFRNNF